MKDEIEHAYKILDLKYEEKSARPSL